MAVIDTDITFGSAPLRVQFNAADSYDPDGNIINYEWRFGDGDTGQGITTSHTYQSEGFYTATLTVRDSKGGEATVTVSIEVSEEFQTSTTNRNGIATFNLRNGKTVGVEVIDKESKEPLADIAIYRMEKGASSFYLAIDGNGNYLPVIINGESLPSAADLQSSNPKLQPAQQAIIKELRMIHRSVARGDRPINYLEDEAAPRLIKHFVDTFLCYQYTTEINALLDMRDLFETGVSTGAGIGVGLLISAKVSSKLVPYIGYALMAVDLGYVAESALIQEFYYSHGYEGTDRIDVYRFCLKTKVLPPLGHSPFRVTLPHASSSLSVKAERPNGKLVDNYDLNAFLIYQDSNDKQGYMADKSVDKKNNYLDNPYSFKDLPAEHDYYVEAYANDMFIGYIGPVSLSAGESLSKTITSTTPGKLKVKTYYNDGSTPLQGAKVKIYSHELETNPNQAVVWRSDTTDSNGETQWFELYPNTREGEKYIAKVYYNGKEVGSKDPVNVPEGDSNEISVVTSVSPPKTKYDITFDENPRVSPITIDGTTHTANELPITKTWKEGTTHSFSVEKSVTSGGKHYKFDHWSDGSTSTSRTITVTEDKTYTAYYTEKKLTYDITFDEDPRVSAITIDGSTYSENQLPITKTWDDGSRHCFSVKDLVSSGGKDYQFDHWSDGNTSSSRCITVSGDKRYTAYYTEKAPEEWQQIWPSDAPNPYCTNSVGKKIPSTGPDSATWFDYIDCGMWKVYPVEPGYKLKLVAGGDECPKCPGCVLGDINYTIYEDWGRWAKQKRIDGPDNYCGQYVKYYTVKDTTKLKIVADSGFYMRVYRKTGGSSPTSNEIKLQGYVGGGIQITGNMVKFSVDVDKVLSGPRPCTYTDLLVKADLDIIGGNINFGGHDVEIYGNYYGGSSCYVFVEKNRHYIKVLD